MADAAVRAPREAKKELRPVFAWPQLHRICTEQRLLALGLTAINHLHPRPRDCESVGANYARGPAVTRGVSERLPTALPARYSRLFAWKLDRRCKAVREVAADLVELWQDLGGVDALSAQQRWLSERVVFLRHRMLAYEAAVLGGTDPPMTAGEYSNFANVCQGRLRTLGLERKARTIKTLRQVVAGPSPEATA